MKNLHVGDTFDYTFTVTKDDLDHYGHMNNASYLQRFEDARWALSEERGEGGRDGVRSSGIGAILRELSIKFKRELTNGESVAIRTVCVERRHGFTHLEQTMRKSDGEVAAIGRFVLVLFDLQTRKVLRGLSKV